MCVFLSLSLSLCICLEGDQWPFRVVLSTALLLVKFQGVRFGRN